MLERRSVSCRRDGQKSGRESLGVRGQSSDVKERDGSSTCTLQWTGKQMPDYGLAEIRFVCAGACAAQGSLGVGGRLLQLKCCLAHG